MKRYYKTENGQEVFFEGNVLYADGATIVNPTEEQMLEAGWLVWQEPEPTAEELLQAAKDEKLAAIDAYDASPDVESFTINGTTMWLGHEVRQQLKTSVEAYSAAGYSNVSKWFGGTEYTFTVSQWLQMLAALEIYAAEALNTTEAHRAAVNAMTDIADVEAFDITAGYPSKLVF